MKGRRWDEVCTAAKSPWRRLAHVIMRSQHGQAIYGVARMDALRRVRPFGNIAADWIKLAEFAMLGNIVEVPETLFRFRRHPTNSVLVTKDWRELVAWHDPTAPAPPRWLSYDGAIVLDYLRSIKHLPMSPADKLLCYCVACVTPSMRGLWIELLRVTGPARTQMREMTGWRWVSPGGSN
jgi:hypothetical protein